MLSSLALQAWLETKNLSSVLKQKEFSYLWSDFPLALENLLHSDMAWDMVYLIKWTFVLD